MKAKKAEAIMAIEARGFIFGSVIAARLNLPFVPARKPGKLPRDTVRAEYALEYGTDSLELHTDTLEPDARVLIHDDLLATGGTAGATAQVLRDALGNYRWAFLLSGIANGLALLLATRLPSRANSA